jgi:hypothetical protein
MPPHYKFIDNFTNIKYYANALYPDPITGDPILRAVDTKFDNQPAYWSTSTNGLGDVGIVTYPLNLVPLGPGSSQRIGRQIRLMRLQMRLFPTRMNQDNPDAEFTLSNFSPEHVRILILYDKQPQATDSYVTGTPNFVDSEVIKMQLNTEPQGIYTTPGNAATLSEDYFANNQQYIYGPLNQASRLRFIPLVDKALLLPVVHADVSNQQYEKFSCPDLKVIEFDIDLEGLLTQFKSDTLFADTTFNSTTHGVHEKLPDSAIATGSLLCCMMSESTKDGNTWCFTGYSRVFYTDD